MNSKTGNMENLDIHMKSQAYTRMVRELHNKLITAREYVISKQLLENARNLDNILEDTSRTDNTPELLKNLFFASQEALEGRYFLRLLDKSRLINVDYSKYLNKIDEIIDILYNKTKYYKSEFKFNEFYEK
jgi:four helix bundle protein